MEKLAIEESLFLYKNIFDKIIEPVVIFDPNGNINYVNETLIKIGEYGLKEIQSKPIIFLLPDREKNRIESLIREVLKEGKTYRDFNTFFQTKNKKEIPIALTLIPLLEGKKIIGGFAIIVDIRQLEGLLEGLNRARSELEQRVKERTRDLEQKTSELEKAKMAIEEAKNILEVKVAARTRELKELNEKLEEKVGQRTKELQEKLNELDKWYRLTVGRELKMIELKEEINKFKKRML
ncbi:MAG: PAS domain S-box protein [Candidatus Nealsonbacteria bacterium]|nr:PAS domain S-box protein [Candidatus Nealsonbacteria bacterium]